MLIHLMDVYSYIFVIKCHLCISEKLCFYTVYIAVILLLDSCMHGGYYLPQKGQRMHDMHVHVLSPEAEDFLHSPDNFCTLLVVTIPILLKFSIKTMNYIQRVNHRQFYCFGFYI